MTVALHTGGSGADSSDNKVFAAALPPPRTKWTRRVLHPVLIGHAASNKVFAAASDQTALLPAEARSTGAPINEGFAAFNGSLALSLTGEGPPPLLSESPLTLQFDRWWSNISERLDPP